MGRSRTHLLLVSHFNLANLANILRAREDLPWEVSVAPLDQVTAALQGHVPPGASALVWTRPEQVSAVFRKAVHFHPAETAGALAEVDAFADGLIAAAGRFQALYVPTWQYPVQAHFGTGELRHGPYDLLARMDLHLAGRVADVPNIHRMHTARWTHRAGEGAWSERAWYLTKTPFNNAVFHAAADDLIAHHRRSTGHAIKLIVLDLDDTLWGGIVGDDGWENLRLGGHDAAGESFVDFQRTLRGLKERGIMLAIASKNDAAVALEAMDKHPEMVLRRDDFVAMRIDWNDKGAHIADMVRELNIGAQSVMFIDDNPVERSRVRTFLPEVFVPEWPANKLLYDRTLRSLPVFALDAATAEDGRRTALYQEEARREQARAGHADMDGWLRSLGMEVRMAPLNDADMVRVHQLFNKTNQFNLTTRRWTEQELRERMADPARPVWSFRVSDRFGDAGLTGILGMDLGGDGAVITDLVLSCRVMGRKVEETMLHVAVEQARRAGKAEVTARLLPTPKNGPCRGFMERSGFEQAGDTFTWDTVRSFPQPATLELVANGSPA
ncbi:MAG: HAD-IIIC family phosphatase [Flavobacteriales bacterium]|jgi:FkbH-like protein|nr:HAD-IIIC family phosphatase [Flavobacteriales bacterium]